MDKYYTVQVIMFLCRRDPAKPAIDEAGFLSLMFLSWATPVIFKSFKRTLQMDDFDELSPYESAEVNFKRGSRLWNEEVNKEGLHNASMPRVFWRATRTRIFFGMSFFVLSQLLSFLGPVSIPIMKRNLLIGPLSGPNFAIWTKKIDH